MNYYSSFLPNVNPYGKPQENPYAYYPNHDYYNPHYIAYPYMGNPHIMYRQQPTTGQAMWTEGGQVTQCGIPWSQNKYMTAAVGDHSTIQCGEKVTVKNLSLPDQKEITVLIVDRVPNFGANNINLHRKAFEALGANVNEGVISVEIIPTTSMEEHVGTWGNYLTGVVQPAYPGYIITDFQFIESTEVSQNQVKDVYEFNLQSPMTQQKMKLQANITYNPATNKVISLDFKEK
ncbi:DUF3889 domain-containing protein [Evansella sp. AB-rgal1]|uniref:DUF3889 domain-containing protein n=1 Tax=Evansella sp. AB-rgal1 TaxID=3242696 RepID=UPI00359F09D8